jgi:hypothetical protein
MRFVRMLLNRGYIKVLIFIHSFVMSRKLGFLSVSIRKCQQDDIQAQKRPKVYACAQIMYLLNTEQNSLTRLPTALPMCNVGRANEADPMRYLVRPQTRCVSHYQLLSTTHLAKVHSAFLSSV